jgi:hypothetical protein
VAAEGPPVAPGRALSIVEAIQAGQVSKAVDEADAWVLAEPDSPAVWGLAARVYLEAAQLAATEAALRRCLLQRAVRPAVPAWFPELHGVPDGLLARFFLARGEADRALEWLMPLLARHPADVELALFTMAAAWLCGRSPALAVVVALLDQVTPIEERGELDQALASAATEYEWPAKSLHDWQVWLGAAGQSSSDQG